MDVVVVAADRLAAEAVAAVDFAHPATRAPVLAVSEEASVEAPEAVVADTTESFNSLQRRETIDTTRSRRIQCGVMTKEGSLKDSEILLAMMKG